MLVFAVHVLFPEKNNDSLGLLRKSSEENAFSLLNVQQKVQPAEKNPISNYPGIEIPRDFSATNSPDIVHIAHLPEEHRIRVFFATKGRCLHPYLRARLSGPALVMIQDWKWQESSNGTGPIMTGTYNVPKNGKYFLEVLMIYCDDFTYEISQLDMNAQFHFTGFNYNFIKECMEDPWKNRLTEPSAFIDMNNSTTTTPVCTGGFWWNKDPNPASQNPMMTRFQTRHCRNNPDTTECQDVASLDRFEHYYFQWCPSIAEKIKYDNLRQEEKMKICLVGQSHSRVLYNASQRLDLASKLNITVEYPCPAQYPKSIDQNYLVHCLLPQDCSKIVVGVGQWSASYSERFPTPIGDYYEQIRVMLLTMRIYISKDIEIFARSIHYNPINDINSVCPPLDWRSPAVIDAYNVVIEKAVRDVGGRSQNISFLDTNFLISPVWDSGFDWCHLSNYISEVEMTYIAAVAVGGVDPRVDLRG